MRMLMFLNTDQYDSLFIVDVLVSPTVHHFTYMHCKKYPYKHGYFYGEFSVFRIRLYR